jgi:hypothetical protein
MSKRSCFIALIATVAAVFATAALAQPAAPMPPGSGVHRPRGTAGAKPPERRPLCGYAAGIGAHPCFKADKQPKGANTFKQMYRPPPK